jgi:4-hydroxy 2-oxovalerate aldolase
VEVGFLDETADPDFDGTKFCDMRNLQKVIPNKSRIQSELVAMIMLGKFPAEKILPKEQTPIDGIRVCFKKNVMEEGMALARVAKERGYNVYLQPASVTDYTDEDMMRLVHLANQVDVKALYIVDTYGLMKKEDVLHYFSIIDKHLKTTAMIGFHSHNNLQLSFSNSQELLKIGTKRTLIIDSSVFGMGRGAGNLCTELITNYINEMTHSANYDLLPIMEIVDEYIAPLFKKYSWGYSVPYYIAAINQCHPNYATYLVDKQTIGVGATNTILKSIPEDKKRNYDNELIRKLYIAYQENEIDDSESMMRLQKRLQNRKVLLLAPGKTISEYQTQIEELAKKLDMVLIAVNSIPDYKDLSMIFVSNLKRFHDLKKLGKDFGGKNIIITSNLAKEGTDDFCVVNYNSLINSNYQEVDNAGMMAIRLLIRLGIEEIYMAGFDGFRVNGKDSFYSDNIVDMDNAEISIERNSSIKEQIAELSQQVTLVFVTPSAYADNFCKEQNVTEKPLHSY